MSTLDDPDALRPARRSLRERAETSSSVNATILLLYTISIVWPTKFQLGPLYMTMSRFIIICLLVPMLMRLFSGRYGGVKTPDITVMLFCIWAFIALAANHGPGAVLEKSIMFFVETTGAYLIGRIFIRNRQDLYTFVKYLLVTVLISVPFVIVEMKTGQPLVLEVLRKINPLPSVFTVPSNVNYEQRLGLDRSQFTLRHPIFFGVYCASMMALALTVRTYGMKKSAKYFWGTVVGIGTFASLSSGAFLSVLLQWGILIFERITRTIKSRWKLLSIFMVVLYIAIDIAASHSPIAVFVRFFSFNPHTAYNRILIFEYGSAEVWRHPIFGIGNNDWVRPAFMPASVDNHWLLDFMRYGFPGGILLLTTVISSLTIVGRAKTGYDNMLMIYQRGYMAALIGWCISLGTVAIGVEVFSYFMTLLAGGIWMADEAQANETGEDPDNRSKRGGRVARGGGRSKMASRTAERERGTGTVRRTPNEPARGPKSNDQRVRGGTRPTRGKHRRREKP